MNDIKKDTTTAEKQNETKNAPAFPVLRAAVIGALGKTGRVLAAALNESPIAATFSESTATRRKHIIPKHIIPTNSRAE